MFFTPFYFEGWALYWEPPLWGLEWALHDAVLRPGTVPIKLVWAALAKTPPERDAKPTRRFAHWNTSVPTRGLSEGKYAANHCLCLVVALLVRGV